MTPAPHDRVLVSLVDAEDDRALCRLDAYRQLLDHTERPRVERFYREADRQRYLITRALVRTMLSRFADVRPEDWRFIANEHGRPAIANLPADAPALRFNVSHTDGMVGCAVTVGRDVGLDIEAINRGLAHDLAGRFFAPREVADLRALDPHRQPLVFFDYWTLKEAYIKARGMGLALPLRHFAFTLTDGAAPTIAFDEEIADDPTSWQFHQAWPSPRHRLAVAVRNHGARLPVEIAFTVPEED